MKLLIVAIISFFVFAFCFAVFLFKAKREEGPPRLHRCGAGPDCHCYEKQSKCTNGAQILDSVSSSDTKAHT
ncbi:MAG: hypothetical protein HKP58_19385 [Desulfatitalea sp.]|nr:hypothetical protein [Desulfatitalea sp.]NNK02580.1 hypothetical protein [Desulfatitalea sp.]